jgi:alkylated DNA nucleotide flippase Atl1
MITLLDAAFGLDERHSRLALSDERAARPADEGPQFRLGLRRQLGWQAVAVDEEIVERVRDAVRAIPPGETASYGEIADRVGLRSARLVGRILAEDGHDLPWHRVLRADGTCAPHIAEEQSARLRAEGVLMENGRLPRPKKQQ